MGPNVWSSYADWCQHGHNAPYVSCERLPENAPVEMIHLRQPSGQFRDPPMTDYVMTMVLGGDAVAELDLGAGCFTSLGRSGEIAVAPPGTECRYEVRGDHELLIFYVKKTLLENVLHEAVGSQLSDYATLHCASQQDAIIESIARNLWRESASGSPMGRLYAEDASVAIAQRLATLAMSTAGVLPGSANHVPPLHGPRLTRVFDRIEADIDQDIGQTTLARAAGMSPGHFCRAFKAATGCAPHRYVSWRRLARAQDLLVRTNGSIAEIASASGYSDQAHMANVFRRETGRTPTAFRTQRKD